MATCIIAQTEEHTIQIVNGRLTITGGEITLTSNETEQLLEVLLIWKYGLEEMLIDVSDINACARH